MALKETVALIPASKEIFKNMNYDWVCGVDNGNMELSVGELSKLLKEKPVTVIDIRELHEQPDITDFDVVKIPLSVLNEQINSIEATTVVFVCQSGKRSLKAAKQFHTLQKERTNVFSLKGGVLQWIEQRPVKLI
jgi:adenylyltransferase/sulfurtransferase